MKSSFNRTAILATLLLAALLCALVTGCSRSTVSTHRVSAEFSLKDLETGTSLLVVEPEVRVEAFKKTFREVFNDSAALRSRIVEKLTDSLRIKTLLVSQRSPVDSSGARHLIRLVSVTFSDTIIESQKVLLPSGTNAMQPVGGGDTKACVVRILVEIENAAGAVVHGFTVQTVTEVPLYAYKTTLSNALNSAVSRVAKELGGEPPSLGTRLLPRT